jgi:hypothetical protein
MSTRGRQSVSPAFALHQGKEDTTGWSAPGPRKIAIATRWTKFTTCAGGAAEIQCAAVPESGKAFHRVDGLEGTHHERGNGVVGLSAS